MSTATHELRTLLSQQIEKNTRLKQLYIFVFIIGIWSEMAATEAQKYGVITHPFPHNGTHVPPPATWNLNPNASYVHYVDNETSEGAEFPYIPDTGDVPLISDMASNIFTKRLDITKVCVWFQVILRPIFYTIAFRIC